MVDVSLQSNITQTLELYLSPRMLQMLKILSLPYLEVIDQISKEAEENVALEVERRDEYVEFLRYITSDNKIRKEADFSDMPGLESCKSEAKSLDQYLLEQLEREDLEENHKKIAAEIIGNINDHGYLLAYPRLRDKIMAKFDVSRPTVDKILKIVQTFEPEGVGARDVKECLLIQIDNYDFANSELQGILTQTVEKHLGDLEKKDYTRIGSALGIPESGVKELASFIKNNLNPYPGSAFGGEACQIIPSFAVEETDSGYKFINLENKYGPIINLSAHYLKMLEDPKTDAKTKEFLKEKIKRAKDLIEDYKKRSETLEKIARKIIDSQQEFLRQGALWLVPLTQKSLAGEFGLHASTISRTVASKFVQTPQGLFPLKYLCPRGPKGVTTARLKVMIKEIINNENKSQPLTDEQITKIINDRGVAIDRRTTAHYRKGLELGTALDRTSP